MAAISAQRRAPGVHIYLDIHKENPDYAIGFTVPDDVTVGVKTGFYKALSLVYGTPRICVYDKQYPRLPDISAGGSALIIGSYIAADPATKGIMIGYYQAKKNFHVFEEYTTPGVEVVFYITVTNFAFSIATKDKRVMLKGDLINDEWYTLVVQNIDITNMEIVYPIRDERKERPLTLSSTALKRDIHREIRSLKVIHKENPDYSIGFIVPDDVTVGVKTGFVKALSLVHGTVMTYYANWWWPDVLVAQSVTLKPGDFVVHTLKFTFPSTNPIYEAEMLPRICVYDKQYPRLPDISAGGSALIIGSYIAADPATKGIMIGYYQAKKNFHVFDEYTTPGVEVVFYITVTNFAFSIATKDKRVMLKGDLINDEWYTLIVQNISITNMEIVYCQCHGHHLSLLW
ncbi:hypothetical protein MTO96_030520 [Rhipicephalus appendiculatus]